MSVAKLDTKREIALRRGLYGTTPRSEVEVTRELQQAAAALAKTTTGWLTFLPKPAAVESVRNCVAGLQRLLTELAMSQGGPPDAA